MRYIYPPRPGVKIHPNQLSFYEDGNWFGQPKFDGDRCGIIIENKNVKFANRHGKFIDRPIIPKNEILQLNFPDGTWLDGELVQNKIIVIYDVLVYNNNYLIGSNNLSRQSLLERFSASKCNGLAFEASDHVWVSITFEKNFGKIFEQLIKNPIVEGVLLRKKLAILDHRGGCEYEVPWQVKSRKPTKNYRF